MVQVRNFAEAAGNSAEATVELLKSLGTKSIVIGETMCMDDNTVQAFILSEAVTDVGPDLSKQLKGGKAAYFKALAGENQEMQVAVMCCLERFLVETDELGDLHATLNQLYTTEVVTDDEVFERWHETPNLSRFAGIDDEGRAASRAAAEPFMEWLRNAADEGSDEE